MNSRQQKVLASHKSTDSLQLSSNEYANYLCETHFSSLKWDINEFGDITTQAVLDPSLQVRAFLKVKSPGVIAGLEEMKFFFEKAWLKSFESSSPLNWMSDSFFGDVVFSLFKSDGDNVEAGDILADVRGSIGDILKIERTLLNFLQRMGGVATLARKYVNACKNFDTLICPTRKTPFGFLDKKACLVGGAGTHRLHLSDAILVKDTHLDILTHDFHKLEGSLSRADRVGKFIEIEVESLNKAWKAIKVLHALQNIFQVPSFVMLDNIKPELIKTFIDELRQERFYDMIFVEASGGIHFDNLLEYAATGVDVLSIGALTHSAPVLDISLKINPNSKV
jgi:nicotinate-nucleotide pyrophosphorylase (carboxylating)